MPAIRKIRIVNFRFNDGSKLIPMVYQLRFKNLPLSNVEILESEAKQHMEHAYYLSEQLSIFDN